MRFMRKQCSVYETWCFQKVRGSTEFEWRHTRCSRQMKETPTEPFERLTHAEKCSGTEINLNEQQNDATMLRRAQSGSTRERHRPISFSKLCQAHLKVPFLSSRSQRCGCAWPVIYARAPSTMSFACGLMSRYALIMWLRPPRMMYRQITI